MLDLFRQQSGSWVIWSLLSIIILAFIFTFNTSGGPITGRPGADPAGTLVEVYGEPIDSADVDLARQLSADPPAPGSSGIDKLQAENRYEGSRMLFSGVASDLIPLTPFDGDVPPVKREKVMMELTETLLVNKDAADRGLGVSDGELTERVLRLQDIFGTKWTDDQGNFDPRKYDIFVRYQLGTTKAHFERFLKREILRDKVAHIVTAGVRVSDKELDAVMVAEKKRPKLEFVSIDANSAKEVVKVSDEDAAAWAKANADKIKSAYEAAGDKYNKPAKWGIRGILLKAPNKDGAEDSKKAEIDGKWAEQKKAADALRGELDVAFNGKTAIDPPPATSGGDAEDAKPAGKPKKITKVKEADRAQWLNAHFERVAKEKTEHDLTKDVGGKFVDEQSAAQLGLAPFGPAVAQAVQAANVGDIVGPLKGSHGWWILRVEEKVDAKITPVEAASVELAKQALAEERAEKELDNLGKSLLNAAKAAKDDKLADVVKAWNKANAGKEDGPLAAGTSGQIGMAPTRAMTGSLEVMLGLPARESNPGDIPGMGNLPEVVKAAWKLTKDAPLADQVFKSTDGKTRFVVRLAAEEPPAGSEEDKKKAKEQEDAERKNLRQTLVNMRKRAAWQAYIKELVAKAEAAEEIDKSDAWAQLVDAGRKRYLEAVKRAAANKPAAPGSSPFNVQVSPPKFSEPKPEPAPAKPAEAPAKPAEAPAK